MPKDDLVYAGHMLEMADKAVALVHEKDRELTIRTRSYAWP